MKAVIMAGGEGTRLRPLTSNAPKPMLPLVNRPMMEHIVELLRRHGIEEIVVTVAFMANTIRTYFGDGSELGVRMVYATEETPLGTAGSVRNAMEELEETFVVISGDVLTDIDLGRIVAEHEEKEALATIGLVRARTRSSTASSSPTTPATSSASWRSRPGGRCSPTRSTRASTCWSREIFEWIPPDTVVDFSGEVFPRILAEGGRVIGSVAEGYWEDLGTLECLRAGAQGHPRRPRAGRHRRIRDRRRRVDRRGSGGAPRGESSAGPAVDRGQLLHRCRRAAAASTPCSERRYGCGGDCELERTVVHDNAYLGESVRLRGTVIGRSADLRRGVRCEEGVVLGDEVFVGEDAVISTNVKVYPFKTIEAGAVVNTSLIWESRGARSLFGRGGVTGLANVDATPELAAKLALAYATYLRKDATVVVSRDSSRAARMLKRAMIAGLQAGGINVLDLELSSMPITRFHARSASVAGGVSLRLHDGRPGLGHHPLPGR